VAGHAFRHLFGGVARLNLRRTDSMTLALPGWKLHVGLVAYGVVRVRVAVRVCRRLEKAGR
jgi:hypothetical protein